jgi:hypothetical protein
MNKDFFIICSALCAAAGAVLYAALAFGLILPPNYDYFGTDIYDAYYYRVMDGRFDLPARMLRFEGHYTSDATGFLYHLFAPLLTRFLLAPFVALNQFPTAAFSIWIWATIGTGLYHLIIVQVLRKFADRMSGYRSILWGALIGLGVWVSGPGLLLSANTAIYHEPIAIAFAAMALAVFLMVRCALFNMPLSRAIIPLAILAGVLMQSRPHMAVGLYSAVGIIGVLALWRSLRSSWAPVTAAALILVAFAAITLQLNAMRFGSMTQAHGQFDQGANTGGVQYGTVFWSREEADSARARSFTEHGTFNPWRILPNLMIYVLDLPPRSGAPLRLLHSEFTKPISGYGRIESPNVGMLFLWTFWVGAMTMGLVYAKPRISGGVLAFPLLIATGVGALLMLSYPTITLRYRIDLWPVVITLCLLSFPGLMHRYGSNWPNGQRVLSASLRLLVIGMLISAGVTARYTRYFKNPPNTFYRAWNAEFCADMVVKKGLAVSEIPRICVDPETVFPHSFTGE